VPLSPEVLAAYENADYVVLVDPELVLRIGEPSPRLDALLEEHGATTAAYLTAANPRGERRSDAQNASAVAALDAMAAAAKYPRYAGEGRDPDSCWPAEPSVLVIGIYRANAEALGRLFGQNAVVFIEKGRAPALVVVSPA
jgi:uncharacterized protein DUF3293